MSRKFGSKSSAISSLNSLKEWSLKFIGLVIFSDIKTVYKYFIILNKTFNI